MIINKHNIDTAFANLRLQADVIIDKGGLVEASVKKKVNRRSLNQNAWLHSLFQEMEHFCSITGFKILPVNYISAELLKAYYKALFGVRSTSKLTTVEFNEFVDKLQLDFLEASGGEWSILTPEFNPEAKGYYNYA